MATDIDSVQTPWHTSVHSHLDRGAATNDTARSAPARVLILTAHTGAGHRTVAHTLATTIDAYAQGTISSTICDVFGLATRSTLLERAVSRGYGAMIVHTPALWGLVYHATNRPGIYNLLVSALGRAAVQRLKRAIQLQRPDLIIATHPLALWMASRCRQAGTPTTTQPPLWAMVTDYVSLHTAWKQPGVECYLVGCPEGAAQMRALGVPEQKVMVTGIPVRQEIAALAHPTLACPPLACPPLACPPLACPPLACPPLACPPLASSRLDTPTWRVQPDASRPAQRQHALRSVLVIGGGEGAGNLVGIVRAIRQAHLGLHISAVCGHNTRAYRTLYAEAGPDLSVQGFVDSIAPLLAQADVVITKAGTVTIAEATTACRPVLLSATLPGQEAGNPALVLDYGAGLHTPGASQVVSALRLLTYDPHLLGSLMDGCRRLASPHAAAIIAATIMDRLAADPLATMHDSRATKAPNRNCSLAHGP